MPMTRPHTSWKLRHLSHRIRLNMCSSTPCGPGRCSIHRSTCLQRLSTGIVKRTDLSRMGYTVTLRLLFCWRTGKCAAQPFVICFYSHIACLNRATNRKRNRDTGSDSHSKRQRRGDTSLSAPGNSSSSRRGGGGGAVGSSSWSLLVKAFRPTSGPFHAAYKRSCTSGDVQRAARLHSLHICNLSVLRSQGKGLSNRVTRWFAGFPSSYSPANDASLLQLHRAVCQGACSLPLVSFVRGRLCQG